MGVCALSFFHKAYLAPQKINDKLASLVDRPIPECVRLAKRCKRYEVYYASCNSQTPRRRLFQSNIHSIGSRNTIKFPIVLYQCVPLRIISQLGKEDISFLHMFCIFARPLSYNVLIVGGVIVQPEQTDKLHGH